MPQSKHADLLNALDMMQQIPYYALRKPDLAKAEQLITSQESRIVELEAALAASAVKVPEGVLEAAHGIDQMTPQMPFDTFLKQQRLVCNFILQLAGKDGGNGIQ